jgi:hypothetical protein
VAHIRRWWRSGRSQGWCRQCGGGGNPAVSSDGGLVRSVAAVVATERSSLGLRICEGGGGEFIL